MIWTTHKQYFHIVAQKDFVASLTASDYKDPPTVTVCNGGGF